MKANYRRLQGVKKGYGELQGVRKDYRVLLKVTTVTGGYKGLQGVTGC